MVVSLLYSVCCVFKQYCVNSIVNITHTPYSHVLVFKAYYHKYFVRDKPEELSKMRYRITNNNDNSKTTRRKVTSNGNVADSWKYIRAGLVSQGLEGLSADCYQRHLQIIRSRFGLANDNERHYASQLRHDDHENKAASKLLR